MSPALLTSTSTSGQASINFFLPASCERSSAKTCTSTLALLRIAAASRSSRSPERAARRRWQPSRANHCAIARPIPFDAPVTSTERPASFRSILISACMYTVLLDRPPLGLPPEIPRLLAVAGPERAENLLVDRDDLARLLGQLRRERDRLALEVRGRTQLVEKSPLAQGRRVQRLTREHHAPGARLADDREQALERRC